MEIKQADQSESIFNVPGKRILYSRKAVFLSLFACFVTPIFFIASYGSSAGAKGIFTLAVPVTLLGAAIGGTVLRFWEKKMQRSVARLVHTKMEKIQETPESSAREEEIHRLATELEQAKISYEHQINHLHTVIAKGKEDVGLLHQEMDKKLDEMRAAYLEFEDLRREYQRLEEESALFAEESQKKLKHKDSLLNEYQRTIAEQRMILEKKQRYIAKLEGKVRDLMYEIRSLLQLEASPTDPHLDGEGLDPTEQALLDSYVTSSASNTPYDYSTQLHRFIEKAENLTGMEHLGGKSPRFLDLSLEGYAVDKRRLLDSFKDDTGGAVFILSLMERKFLFVHSSIKSLCGWSQEKFIKEFPQLVVSGLPDWEEALSRIRSQKECSLRLTLLGKGGVPQPVECYLGRISKGPFANHAIGLFAQI